MRPMKASDRVEGTERGRDRVLCVGAEESQDRVDRGAAECQIGPLRTPFGERVDAGMLVEEPGDRGQNERAKREGITAG